MDDKLLEALAADDVGTFSMDSGLTTGDFGWGSATFHKMVRSPLPLQPVFSVSAGYSEFSPAATQHPVRCRSDQLSYLNIS